MAVTSNLPYDPDRPIRVLIADDEEPYRMVMLQRFAHASGFIVEAVDNGAEALARIATGDFDVVMLDYMMPAMNGLQVLEALVEQKSDVPVIMLTGAGSENIAAEAMKLGAYDYAAKQHLDLAHLPVLVRGVHERHQFRREKEQRLNEERTLVRSRAHFEQLQRAVSSIEHIANTTLAVMSLALEECEQELAPLMRSEGLPHLERAVRMMKQDHRLLTLTIRSLMDLSATLSAKLGESPTSLEKAQDLDRQLQAIQERLATFRDPEER